jgi:hypothetical protein
MQHRLEVMIASHRMALVPPSRRQSEFPLRVFLCRHSRFSRYLYRTVQVEDVAQSLDICVWKGFHRVRSDSDSVDRIRLHLKVLSLLSIKLWTLYL